MDGIKTSNGKCHIARLRLDKANRRAIQVENSVQSDVQAPKTHFKEFPFAW
jgi:hypothetical protein